MATFFISRTTLTNIKSMTGLLVEFGETVMKPEATTQSSPNQTRTAQIDDFIEFRIRP